MKKALVVGGNSGIGLAITLKLLLTDYDFVYIVGKDYPKQSDVPEKYSTLFAEKTSFFRCNFVNEEFQIFDSIQDVQCLIITAGFGRVAPFENLTEAEIKNLLRCNQLAVLTILKKYYDKINSKKDFYCAVMGSIAGHLVSPLFSVYGATKAGLCSFMENVNIELSVKGVKNRILDVSPGSLKGTQFSGGKNDVESLFLLSEQILERMYSHETLYIPQYDEVYKNVLERYHTDGKKFGEESYGYKLPRVTDRPQVVVGYLSGTFDLFHVGHLNLLRRAKAECDYLIVGVHKSGSWKGKETFISFEDRVEILKSVKYVDEVVESCTEDSDAYDKYRYDKLFVGSDYKGTERFNKYEKYFADKNVEIIYFPYTQKVSSTKLRDEIKNKN